MTKPAALKRHLPTSPFAAKVTPAPKDFAVGDQVTHDMYGLGRVTGVEDGIAVLVDFGSTEERILSPYAKMTKL
ncbi:MULTISPECIES: CarD family transcriptional regulator [Streptomyces]|uniref:CarD family transcriptional regulator n=1 Tax=Streptomyces TaxID=1883 RepID=UPI001CCA9C61|nr:CarD family transcriptional regulator [Streptomyces mobaraensis]UBI38793.1 CarD family transcriptional regulator [Streptomyces mobaraensis]